MRARGRAEPVRWRPSGPMSDGILSNENAPIRERGGRRIRDGTQPQSVWRSSAFSRRSILPSISPVRPGRMSAFSTSDTRDP